MKKSLKNAPEGETAEPEVVDAEAMAEVDDDVTGVTVAPSNALAIGNVGGAEIDPSDLIIPRLNIFQPTSTVGEGCLPGDVLYNKEVVLAHEGEAVNLAVLSIEKFYKENLDYGDESIPRTFQSREELVAAGFYTEWKDDQKPSAVEVATVLVLLEEPEGIDALGFNYEFEGKNYALALWTLQKSSYNSAAKKIFSALRLELKGEKVFVGAWQMQTEKRSGTKGNYWVPVMKLTGKNSPEKVKFITTDLS